MDKESIKKALKNCQKNNCLDCPYFIDEKRCRANDLLLDAITLINELESENERLKNKNYQLEQDLGQCENGYKLELHTARYQLHSANEDLKKAEKRIAELEKENDDYYERCVILRRENEQLKTLVSSLEKKNIDLEEYIKGNEQDAKAFVNGWHKDLEAELKQFAERLKEQALSHCKTINCYELKFIEETIDKLLKEYEK